MICSIQGVADLLYVRFSFCDSVVVGGHRYIVVPAVGSVEKTTRTEHRVCYDISIC